MNTNKKTERRSKPDSDAKIVQIDRVARVVAGGRRFRFRAAVVVGDNNGHVGIGVAKGSEVSVAISKATYYAKKNMIEIVRYGTTVPYQLEESFGGARILLKPASPGTGIIAGGAVRAVLESAGIQDILSKIMGSNNKINNIKATFNALQKISELSLKNKDLMKIEKPDKSSKDKKKG